MSVENTLSIVKPDAVKRDLTGKIIAMFEEKELRVVAQKKIWLSKTQAGSFYAVHKDRPFFDELDRKFALESCKYVDEVYIFTEETPYELIKRVEPSIIVKGGDYKLNDVVGNDIAEVVLFNYIDGYSTTKTLGKINHEVK